MRQWIVLAGTFRKPSSPPSSRFLETLVPFICENVEESATVCTDFQHGVINHQIGKYVDGIIHTNGIENFWSLLKRGLLGTYVSIAKEHPFR